MLEVIEGPNNCEIWYVLRFMNGKKCELSEIHCQICEVYGVNTMSDTIFSN